MEEAAKFMGRMYSVSGEIIVGNKLGRTIGFPTCNILVDDTMITPPNGVYITTCTIDGVTRSSVTNVGVKPTIGTYEKNIETHIFDFNEDVYGKQIREFVKKTNEKSPHKILMLMNGHHHKDFLRIIDNTIYWDVNTTRYELICEKPHDVFPEEICKKHILANRTMVYNEPLSAVVTVEGTSVTIDGVETEAFMGVTRETHGDWVLDRSGRPSTPRITSAKITLE
jgi:hypothetical protein